MKRWIYWIVISLGVVALGWIVLQLRPHSAKQRRFSSIGYEEAVAFTFGKTIRDTLPGDGEILVVQLPSATDAAEAAGERKIRALTEGLGKTSSRVVWVSPRRLPRQEQYALMRSASVGTWGEQFLQWVDGHPQPRAIVSFMGLPGDVPAARLQKLGPLVVFGSGGEKAHAWAVPRGGYSGKPPNGKSPQEVFDAQFELRLSNRTATALVR